PARRGRLAPAARPPPPARAAGADFGVGVGLGGGRTAAVPPSAELCGLRRRAPTDRRRAADLLARLVPERHASLGRRATRRSARALGRRRRSLYLPPATQDRGHRRHRRSPQLVGLVRPVALALLLDALVGCRCATRAGHHDAVLLDDILGTRVPVLVALNAAARVAGPVERMDVPLLPRHRRLVLPLAEEPLPHGK